MSLEDITAADFMLATFKNTDVSVADVYMIGEAVLNWIGTMHLLGHASPGGTLDYISDNPLLHKRLVRDFIALTSGRKKLAPGCDERIREWIVESGWLAHQMNTVGRNLGLADEPAAVSA